MNRRFVLFACLMGALCFAMPSPAASYRHGYNSCSIAIPAVNTQVTLAGALSMAKIIYDNVKQPFKGNLEITAKIRRIQRSGVPVSYGMTLGSGLTRRRPITVARSPGPPFLSIAIKLDARNIF
jgi:hypothetical protein